MKNKSANCPISHCVSLNILANPLIPCVCFFMSKPFYSRFHKNWIALKQRKPLLKPWKPFIKSSEWWLCKRGVPLTFIKDWMSIKSTILVFWTSIRTTRYLLNHSWSFPLIILMKMHKHILKRLFVIPRPISQRRFVVH